MAQAKEAVTPSASQLIFIFMSLQKYNIATMLQNILLLYFPLPSKANGNVTLPFNF